MKEIAPLTFLLPRDEWQPDARYPRLGATVDRAERTEAILHHTVYAPNVWRSVDEVRAEMHKLQVARPDLGRDVPYNFVAFLMRDGVLVLAEGRGARLQGAHTRGHNRTGIAIAVHGNFERPTDVGRYAQQISRCWGYLRDVEDLANLGSVAPRGRDVFGHRDLAATACPGRYVMEAIDSIRIESYVGAEEAEMRRYAVRVPIGYFEYLSNGVTKHHIRSVTTVARRIDGGLLDDGARTPIILDGTSRDALMALPDAEPIT